MKPFPESRRVTVTQLNFNQWLSWAWITVELALDASKDDGGTSLNKMRHILPLSAANFNACCVLHNFLETHNVY